MSSFDKKEKQCNLLRAKRRAHENKVAKKQKCVEILFTWTAHTTTFAVVSLQFMT